MKYMAHSPREESNAPHAPSDWQTLSEHARGVAALTHHHLRYLAPYVDGIEDLGLAAGLMHDLGKYRDRFQLARLGWNPHTEQVDTHLKGAQCEHSDAGARYFALAMEMDGVTNSELPFVIAGHHSGLSDLEALERRLDVFNQDKQDELEILLERAQADLPELTPLFARIQRAPLEGSNRAFLIRILHSALIDSDRLDTEAHGSPEKTELRSQEKSDLVELLARLEAHMTALETNERSDELINTLRRDMYTEVCRHAGDDMGFFRLTVPTGGGKTLTSLAFALKHAEHHGLRRVIYGVPLTTIIEQTAQIFRDILQEEGELNVLEHHSNIIPSIHNQQSDEQYTRDELLTENWDAPVIVTTTVRLFQETLFGSRNAQLRRLHNLSGSVIVLDEAQNLPAHLLRTTLSALEFLVNYACCSVVLCTATQPALDERLGFPSLGKIRDLIADPEQYFKAFQRVQYELRDEPLTSEELAFELSVLPQVLCVVNTRRAAKELFETLRDRLGEKKSETELFHLSTHMVPRHRQATLQLIRKRLVQGLPCRVISTQLIEAGVDIDFPTVYRARGPLESVVQAAGRCNREGKLEQGKVVVFVPEEHRLPGGDYPLREGLAATALKEGTDLHHPAAFYEYFRDVYGSIEDNYKWFKEQQEKCNFLTIDKAFRMIDEDTVPVIVRGYATEKVTQLLEELGETNSRKTRRLLWQQLQGYTVNLYHSKAIDLRKKGLLTTIPELSRWPSHYEVYEWPSTAHYDEKLGIIEELSEEPLVF